MGPHMAVFIQIPENPNCEPVDGQVFQCRTSPRAVTQVRIEHGGSNDWCDITGIDEGDAPCPDRMFDRGFRRGGMLYLVIGGAWGVRLKRPPAGTAWSM